MTREPPTAIPPQHCPSCGKLNDLVSPVGGGWYVPCAGDISICIGCGSVMQFDDQMILRCLTRAELADELVRNVKLARALVVMKRYFDETVAKNAPDHPPGTA